MRLLFLALILLSPLFMWTMANGATGLLGSVVPWPLGYPAAGKNLSLSPYPPATLVASPRGTGILYGAITLGNGTKKLISIAVQLGDDPHVWVDANNDRNLCNDGGGEPDNETVAGNIVSYFWYFKVQVSYDENGQSLMFPYYLNICGHKVIGQTGRRAWSFSYFCGGLRKGLIKLDGEFYNIFIGDRDTDGVYKANSLTVLIDVNHDGKISWDNAVYEMFAPPKFPIYVGTSIYSVKKVSPDGREIDLEKAEEMPTAPSILTPGHRAPDFAGKTITGKAFSLSDYRGKVVIFLAGLFFPQEQSASTCTTCAMPGKMLQRALIVQKLVAGEPAWLRKNIAIIGVAAGPNPPTPTTVEKMGIKFPIVLLPSTNLNLVGRFTTMLIIDQQGIIQLTDTYIVRRNGPRITGIQYCYVDPYTIMMEVEKLVK